MTPEQTQFEIDLANKAYRNGYNMAIQDAIKIVREQQRMVKSPALKMPHEDYELWAQKRDHASTWLFKIRAELERKQHKIMSSEEALKDVDPWFTVEELQDLYEEARQE